MYNILLGEVGLFIENLTIVQIYDIMAYNNNILDRLKIDIDMIGNWDKGRSLSNWQSMARGLGERKCFN